MLSTAELTSIARARLKDASALLANERYDGAAYLCGYAIEIALKARIAKTLRWTGFPAESSEFKGLTSFQTHNLKILLYLSGWEAKIKTKFPIEWSKVNDWNPEFRYRPPGKVMHEEALAMFESSKKIVEALL